ncbi:MAG: tRNA 2-selenouridine(34) synthase MnmH, partial [Marinobacter sp.]|nr:tRNA 2-selenouridine(34) synthase MnmH [Marinobacter sp.]
KRLGGERHQQLRNRMVAALEQQQRNGDTGGHDEWIRALLEEYYDPMYDYQLSQKKGRIVVEGDPATIVDWANQ